MRRLWLLIPAGTLLAVAIVAERPARAQDAASAEGARHFGAGSCAAQACHGGNDGALADHPARAEYKVWMGPKDEHSKAFEHLSNDLGRRIGARLNIDPTTSERCLNCHGTLAPKVEATFKQDDGVSCELCHGGAEKWLKRHALPEWKELSPAAKEKRGLRDLSKPDKRAQACVECHVAGAGRDITHDIMAAGHPPLVFDAARFTQTMPPHWNTDDEADWTTETWVQGHAAGAAAYLERIARETKNEEAPDFYVFDCYSCHHPVYTGSIYERKPLPGKPGALPYQLGALKVLAIATGRVEALQRLDDSLRTWSADGNNRGLSARARAGAAAVRKAFPPGEKYEKAVLLGNLDAYLAQAAAGAARVPRAEMQQIQLAIAAFGGGRENDATAALAQALDAKTPYDAANCAALARQALAAISD